MARYPHGNPTYRKTAALRGLMASLATCLALVTSVAWATPSTMPSATFELRTETRCRHMAEAAEGLTLVEDFKPAIGLEEGEYELSVALHLRDDDGHDLGILKVDNEEVTVTEAVTPGAIGDMSAAITLDATGLEGQTLVAFATLSKDGSVIARREDIDDEEQAVHLPMVTATLAAQDGTSETMGETQTTLTARVSWSNVRPDAGLRAVVTLIDAETGEPLRDANDREVTSLPMIPQDDEGKITESGAIDVPVAFNAKEHLGKRVTALARLIHDGQTIASEAWPDDVGIVGLPRIATTLADGGSGLPVSAAAGEATLSVTVAYEALAPGTTYVLTSNLVDAETGEPLAGADGIALEGASTVREVMPTKESGTVELTHTIDARNLAGSTISARTTLTRKTDGTTLATCDDPASPSQPLWIPRITTHGLSSTTGIDEIPADTTVRVKATVAFHALPAGTYEATLSLVDPETGEDATNERPSTTFEANGENGDIDLEWTVDTTGLAGRILSTTTHLISGGVVIAADYGSEKLYVPTMAADLHDGGSGSQMALAQKETRLEGTVTVSGISPGATHEVRGTLIDAETEMELTDGDGNPITSSSTISHGISGGSATVAFTLDARKFAGRDVCARYELVHDGFVVAATPTSGSVSGTVQFPMLTLEARSEASGDHELPADGRQKAVTKLDYANVLPGITYHLVATLADAESGAPVKSGKALISAEAEVTPSSTNGTAELILDCGETAGLAGRGLAVTAVMELGGRTIATADEAKAGSQALRVPSIATTLHAKDGSHEVTTARDVRLVDTITYSNLIPGVEYTVEGELVDASTGKPAIRVVRTESQASSSQGTSTGQAKSSEAAKDSFEGKEDATTVWVSEDSTYHLDDRCASATGSIRRTTLGIAKAAGKSPCATESGKTTKVTETSKAGTTTTTAGSTTTQGAATEEEVPVTAEATFTPTEASGIVEVEFSLDATGLEGKKLVALETLKRDKHTVATHRDAGDAEQTVTVTNGADGQGSSAESMGQTGVGGELVLSIIAGVTLAVIGFELLVRHGSPSESDDGSSEHTDDGATDGHR